MPMPATLPWGISISPTSARFKAIFAAARELQLPVLIGVSEGEREFIGVRQAAALIKSLREHYEYPIFLNADHTHSLDKAKEAAEAGFDEIIFDNSSLPMEQNIANTKEAVAAIRAINPEIVIEGEIGYIGSIIGDRRQAAGGIAHAFNAGRGGAVRDKKPASTCSRRRWGTCTASQRCMVTRRDA